MGRTDEQISNNERKNWENLFRACVETINIQKITMDSLVKERKFLGDRIEKQHDRWASRIRLLNAHISQMRSDILKERSWRSVDVAQSDYSLCSKEREALMYKLKLDHAADDIENAKMLVDCLKQKCSNSNDLTRDSARKYAISTKNEEQRKEVTSLEQKCKKLSLQKDAEVASLLLQNEFVWNQYKTMENDFTDKLTSKQQEVEQAKAKIKMLLSGSEQLQASNDEKDVMIIKLKTKLAEIEADEDKRKDEVSRLSKELDLLKKSKGSLVTPLLSRCNLKPTGPDGKENDISMINVAVKKESSTSKGLPEKGTGSSKRKINDVIVIDDSPKLFKSTFKVPKLKKYASPFER